MDDGDDTRRAIGPHPSRAQSDGGRRRRWRLLRRALAAVIVVAVGSIAVVATARPWAIAAVREGFPAPEWPAAGRFAEQGDPDRSPPLPSDSLIASAEFLASFENSDGSAIAVSRDGRIVYSHFGPGSTSETAFNSYSMVKSLVGFLTLQAVSEGSIDGLDVTVGELWDDAADSPIAQVTVRGLLDMRSGIVFEHPAGDVGGASTTKEQAVTYSPFSNFSRLHIEGPDAVLDHLTVVDAEAERFVYQNLNTAVLGRILEEVTGRPLEELVETEIADPAGAGGFRWRQYPSTGRVSAYCCLYATVGWWVAVANHLLDNGGDDQMLSADWHAYFLGTDLTDDELVDGVYRSQVRYNIFDREGETLAGPFLFFTGRGGQVTYLVPGEDLVVVRFGHLNQLLWSTVYQVASFGER